MAGQPVVNPFSHMAPSQPLGTQQQGADSLQFFTPPASNMQSGGVPTQPLGQPFGGAQAGGFAPPQQPVTDFDIENEPPLLEELGINIDHIWLRMQGVAFFKKVNEEILNDCDLSGPLVIGAALGVCLLLAGKLHFGYIYGLAVTACLCVCLLLNVMSQKGGIDLYRTMSILGYGLLPVVFLAFIGIILSLKSGFGTVLSVLCICWSTATASRFFATAISMHQQRWLVAYPVGLVYVCFALITVF